MSATTEDPEALRFDSHGGGSRNALFRVYRQPPAGGPQPQTAFPFFPSLHPARLMGGISSSYYDLSRLVVFNSGDMHTRRGDGLDRPGHVLLPECGRRACHGKLSAVIVGGGFCRGGCKKEPGGTNARLFWGGDIGNMCDRPSPPGVLVWMGT